MKKFILIFITLLVFPPNVYAENIVLRGSVQYTVESARKLAFEGLDLKIDKKLIEPYLKDENNKENRAALKINKQPSGRYLMAFSTARNLVKGYVVVYDDKPEFSYYYSTSGYLVAIDADKKQQEDEFPYKIGKYSALTGNLISIGLYVSEDEQYVYTKDGKLKAHWVGNTGYNANGRPIASRKAVDEIPLD